MQRKRNWLRGLACCGGAAACWLAVSCGTNSGSAPEGAAGDSAQMLVVDLPLAEGRSLTPEGENSDLPTRSYDTIRMGRIAEGEVIEGEFSLRNVGERPLVVVQIITGCGCTATDYDPAPIAAGESRVVKWRFDAKGRFGQQFKSIEVVTAERQCATIYLEGEVVMATGR